MQRSGGINKNPRASSTSSRSFGAGGGLPITFNNEKATTASFLTCQHQQFLSFGRRNKIPHYSVKHARGAYKSTFLQMVATDEDNHFMTLLQSRINQVKENENKIPLIVLDCMVPRQVLRIQANDEMLLEVVRHQLYKENPTFGMVGTVALNAWEKVHLNTGVEVEIIQKPNFVLGKGVMLELKAKRRFVIVDDEQVKITKEGWSEATVQYLNSCQQEQLELATKSRHDKHCIMRAIEKAKELTVPNNPKLIETNNQKESLVGRWIQLAREQEKHAGQIDRLLDDIGKIPPENEPSERAFWVGALVNSLPSLGVSMDVRPALLTAASAEKRVEIACDAILKSIRHMEGTEKLW